MSANDNHRTWAKHYDEVNRRCFGPAYDELTGQTLQAISAIGPNLRIADFGAGTGRLSLPLAAAGHQITAIEPSQAMFEQLSAKDTGRLIEKHNCTMGSYSGPSGHDLAIAVFTVIAYITTKEELAESFRRVAVSLKPGGAFLLDVPRRVLFRSNHVQFEGLDRKITFTETEPNLFTYDEQTRLGPPGDEFTYQDTFRLRYWTEAEVRTAIEAAGMRKEQDWSDRFPMAGAEYWLCRKKLSC